jgi:hypothetical protein
VAKAQTELRISVPNCKQFFIHLHNTDLTWILSQKPSHKFSNKQFSHKSCREWPLLVDWFPDTTRATNHFCHASHVPPVRLEVLGEGGSGRQRAMRRKSITASSGRLETKKMKLTVVSVAMGDPAMELPLSFIPIELS